MTFSTSKALLDLSPDGHLRTGETLYAGLSKDLIRSVRQAIAAIGYLRDDAVHLTLELIRADDALTAEQRTSVFLFGVALQLNYQRGCTCLSLADPVELRELLDLTGTALPASAALPDVTQIINDLRALAASKASVLIGGPGHMHPIIIDKAQAYIGRIYASLTATWQRIAQIGSLSSPHPGAVKLKKALGEVTALGTATGTARHLTAQQVQAVTAAVSNGLTVITGGPGTGKTTIVVTILRVLFRLGVRPQEIGLATTTGRAALHMQQTIRDAYTDLGGNASTSIGLDDGLGLILTASPPQTLHKLLGSMGSIFRHRSDSKLVHKWVIVDESSMIDIHMAKQVVESLGADAKLILLGDADQLPPVGAGTFFRDLITNLAGTTASKSMVVALTENHRTRSSNPGGRNIMAVAGKILNGSIASLFAPTAADDETITIHTDTKAIPDLKTHLITTADRDQIWDFGRKWFDLHLAPTLSLSDRVFTQVDKAFKPEDTAILDQIFTIMGGSRMMCPSNEGLFGTQRINQIIREHRDHPGKTAKSYGIKHLPWLTGELVMMTANDYQIRVFNGDLGVILPVKRDDEPVQLMALFPSLDGYGAYSLAQLGDKLVRAYATTVHKAQGDEHQHVALILPPEDTLLHTRELIYTAVTRAKHSVVIVGKQQVLEAAITRKGRRQTSFI